MVYGLRINGAADPVPATALCCIGEGAGIGDVMGGGSGTITTVVQTGDVPEVVLDVIWIEVHSDITYEARLGFSANDIAGWTGGTIFVTLSFRPGGSVILYGDGPELAATRPGKDVDLRDGDDMRAFLLSPGLERAHRRADYSVLRRVCGTVNPDPPNGFTSGRASLADATLARIDATRDLPLPAPDCAG
ncbi:hypothetical protein [Flavimaricola marinus]|uniref:Uncharacterized protein n=1 Tax=Flavimaricola marinus TaxID=1819565 RepID=A0A238LG51_9RHOB|nr:hypothetical protein [Flavimaricola marinus]SMY08385.1 hypothetical protein LOM8899_02536 [Flavimaricola marinus]